MTNVLTEGEHRRGFLVSQANGGRSWETGTLKSGQDLKAGAVLMWDAGELVAHDGDVGTDGNPNPAAGILDDNVDASVGAKQVVYMARDGEVNLAELVYPEPDTALPGATTNVVAALADLGIIAR